MQREDVEEATDGLEHGVPLFLDQLVETLRLEFTSSVTMEANATRLGNDLLRRGSSIAQVVHCYGDICQAITELAVERDYPITAAEFQIFNRCLDDAIASAVYERQRDQFHADENTERLGIFSHELRNLINTASLAFEALSKGAFVADRRGAVLARSLDGLRLLVNRSLTEVRLDSGVRNDALFPVDGFIEEVEISAAIEAQARGLEFTVHLVERGLLILADRQILASVVANLLHNAFKFTKPRGTVSLTVTTEHDRILFAIKDECGGLAPNTAETLFRPFEQRDLDRTGLGLGLVICLRGVQACGGTIDVRDLPSEGCIFTVNLPNPQLAVP